MHKVRCYTLMGAEIQPGKEILLGCFPQTIFKAAVVEAYARTEGAKIFLAGQSFAIPAVPADVQNPEGVTYTLENTTHGNVTPIGEMLLFHVKNESESPVVVVLKAKGYGMDVAQESCVNDPEAPVVAVIEPMKLQRPIHPVLTREQAMAITGGEPPDDN